MSSEGWLVAAGMGLAAALGALLGERAAASERRASREEAEQQRAFWQAAARGEAEREREGWRQAEKAKAERLQAAACAEAEHKAKAVAAFCGAEPCHVVGGSNRVVSNCVAYIKGRIVEAHTKYGGLGEINVWSPLYHQEPGLNCLMRAIFVSQRCMDGKDRFLFGMYNYEFPDPLCQDPNTVSRVYISYLDGTGFYEKDNADKFKLNFDIMNAYLEFVSAIGYKAAHIWACPPRDVQNAYIFQGSKGTVNTADQLFGWYKKFCAKYHWACRDTLPSGDLPQFPGDCKCDPDVRAAGYKVLAINLRVHAQFNTYSDASNIRQEAYATRQALMTKLSQLDFSTDDSNAASTTALLEMWQQRGMVEKRGRGIKFLDGADDAFKMARRRQILLHSERCR